jgi:hypothetical protein
MNSKVFFDVYLQREKYKTMMKSDYIIASDRIRRSSTKWANTIIVKKDFVPSAHCYSMGTEEEMRQVYFDELSTNATALSFLVLMIKESIENDTNFILLTSKIESKIHYLDWLAEFVYEKFGYPIIDYNLFVKKGYVLKYNKADVLKRVKRLAKLVEKRSEEAIIRSNSSGGKAALKERYRQMSKKELIKRLKSMDLYYDNMSKSEMIDTLEAFAGI